MSRFRLGVSIVVCVLALTSLLYAQGPWRTPYSSSGKARIISTAADALGVGCTGPSPASTDCTGGLYAGPTKLSGLLTANVAGALTFHQVDNADSGTQHNFNPGILGNTIIRLTNAAPLTITGFPAGVNGQVLIVYADVDQVNLSNQTGSSVGNQLLNAVAGVTSLGPRSTRIGGSATYVYDATLGVWRLVQFQQGEPISFTPVWGNNSGSNSVGNGTLTGTYVMTDRVVTYDISIVWGSTTASGPAWWTMTLPYASILGPALATAYMIDISSGNVYPGLTMNYDFSTMVPALASAPVSALDGTIPFTWATGDILAIHGSFIRN